MVFPSTTNIVSTENRRDNTYIQMVELKVNIFEQIHLSDQLEDVVVGEQCIVDDHQGLAVLLHRE